MKQWNKDDLILFYYGELNQCQNREIRKALAESTRLQQDYADLCDFLDNQTCLNVPLPEANLNQRIMASFYQLEEIQNKTRVRQTSKNFNLLTWLREAYWHKLVGASVATMFVVTSIFLLGRWTSQLEQKLEVAEINPTHSEQSAQQGYFDGSESQRVLISHVSAHMEIGGRILTLVSNGNGDLSQQIESRRHIIEELVVLNRLYRRLVEQSGDKQLAHVLQQMESILIELNHTEVNAQQSDLQDIKDRLENSDLIYRLKVTGKKLNQKLI